MIIDFKIFESYNHSEYLKWKKQNVTIRGVQELGEKNGGMAKLGNGLYTAFLNNKHLAKQYGKVYFVVGAKPKNPKIFKTINDWEIWFYNKLVCGVLKDEMPDERDFFKKTSIEKELMKMGYDGVSIIGREMVNYTPDMDNVMYFENEDQLNRYYGELIRFQR